MNYAGVLAISGIVIIWLLIAMYVTKEPDSKMKGNGNEN